MSVLIFYVEDNRYAIDNRYILRIIPKVELKNVPSPLNYVAGVINLAGKPIVVVDFCRLIAQRDTQAFLHSRIILIQALQTQTDQIIGILGERVSDILPLQPEQFSEIELSFSHFSFLDKVYSDEKGVIQWINIEEFFRFISTELSRKVWE